MGAGRARTTPVTSRTSSRGWRSRWPRRRSPACCGSPGTRSGRSSSGSSPTTSTSAASTGLVAIGVDEISYRRGQRYLTTVVDHRAGAIVWCAPGRNAQTLQAFFDLLGERRHSIRAVSIDMSGGYQQAIRDAIPRRRDLL